MVIIKHKGKTFDIVEDVTEHHPFKKMEDILGTKRKKKAKPFNINDIKY